MILFGTVLINSNTVHRHEPPITNDSILVLHIDREREFIVISKPGSVVRTSYHDCSDWKLSRQPVHATGRYFRHTVLEIMESDYNVKCYGMLHSPCVEEYR